MSFLGTDSKSEIYGEVFSNLIFTIVFSIIASYILIYIFQKLKGHNKLFLLISILLLLYAIGKMFHLSSLIIILIFGVILNNYTLFFKGGLINYLNIIKSFRLMNLFFESAKLEFQISFYKANFYHSF